MALYLVALLIGVVAGLRTMTAPAAVAWAARLGSLHLAHTPLAFLGATATPIIFTLLAAGELVVDTLPNTPSRKVPMQFGGRLLSGALCGAAVGLAGNALVIGLVAGVVGAAIGTLAGADLRTRLAGAFGRDLPAALVEDVVAVGGAALLMGLSF